jgi:hypothetical protein
MEETIFLSTMATVMASTIGVHRPVLSLSLVLRSTPVPSSSPSSAPSFSAVPSSAPSYIPTQAPTVSAAPSATPTISMAPTSVVYSFCGDLEQYRDQDCLSVDSWSDFVSAIASASGTIVFCAFTIKNDADGPVIVDKDINMHCPSRSCVIYGPSTHLRVEGDTQHCR